MRPASGTRAIRGPLRADAGVHVLPAAKVRRHTDDPLSASSCAARPMTRVQPEPRAPFALTHISSGRQYCSGGHLSIRRPARSSPPHRLWAAISVKLDGEGNSVRLRVEDLRTGQARYFDPLQLEALVWLSDERLTSVLDPSADRWRDDS